MLVAEWVAGFLASRGVSHAFGIVGGANLTLFSELSKRMEIISCCHEQAAAIAAAYYYKVKGFIAPCIVTAGGGSANAITGVMEAQMDGIPLLVISGNELSRFIKSPPTRTIGFQGFNPVDVVKSFTKNSLMADNPLAVRFGLDTLYRTALQHRQGAVWIDIPQDIAAAKMDTAEVVDPWRGGATRAA